MGSEPGQDGTKPETRRLLTAAEYFLQRRSFADCCKYAARTRDSDPANPEPTRILSTAAVLSASKVSSTQHDYYAILNLPQFDSDASRIGSSFEALASILDPNTVMEAMDLGKDLSVEEGLREGESAIDCVKKKWNWDCVDLDFGKSQKCWFSYFL